MEAARAAATADLDEIARVATTAADELRDQRGGPLFLTREHIEAPTEAGFAALLTRDDRRLVVGTIDDVIVGYAAGGVERLADGSNLGVITDLHVLSGARQVGVGEAMVDDLLAWFDGQGCTGIDAFALPGNRAAKNFFETNGFTARLLVMHRRSTPYSRP